MACFNGRKAQLNYMFDEEYGLAPARVHAEHISAQHAPSHEPKRIYLVRHAQCVADAEEEPDSSQNSPLTELGLQQAKAAANHHKVKVGVNAFVIARDTEEEARAVLAQIIEQADPEAVNAFGDAAKQAGKSSPEGEGNWAKSSFEDLVQ